MGFKKEERQKIYDKCGHKCAYCGNSIELKEMQIDHIIPQCNYMVNIKNKYKIPKFLTHLTEIDINHFDNLLPTCRTCNKWKVLSIWNYLEKKYLNKLND